MIRLFIEHARFQPTVILNQREQHYLRQVMRRSNRSSINIFNQVDGEWQTHLDNNHLELLRQIQPPIPLRPTSIAVGCIRKPRLEWLVEKVSEVGVSDLFLLQTEYSQYHRYDMDRLDRIAVEAAEQSGRMSILTIHTPQPLAEFVTTVGSAALIHPAGSETECDLRCGSVLIGPEGGWSERELELMRDMPRVSLGQSILRTETAAIIVAHMLVHRS
jgi:16S rRNA (uracil1498-N3)-methyltransferase